MGGDYLVSYNSSSMQVWIWIFVRWMEWFSQSRPRARLSFDY